MKYNEGEKVLTNKGEAKIIRVESVFGSFDDRLTVIYPDKTTCQYSSATVRPPQQTD